MYVVWREVSRKEKIYGKMNMILVAIGGFIFPFTNYVSGTLLTKKLMIYSR